MERSVTEGAVLPEVACTFVPPDQLLRILDGRCRLRVHRGSPLHLPGAVADFIGGAEAALTLLGNPVTDEVLETCTKLRVVANCAVGFDNIDLEAARRRGLWVTNTPDVLTEATADLTWALILAVTRRIVAADRFLRAGDFKGWSLDLLLGAGLQGKTLGIVGFGRIGRAVARRAQAFGVEVVFSDRVEIAGIDRVFRQLDLDDLVEAADIVTIHCPLNESTRHLFDDERLARMRPGAFLINTARGPLVHEEALVRVLEGGLLAGAGLDVYEEEPLVHPGLLQRDDVVLLPHIGSATVETRTMMAARAAENAAAVLAGEAPPNPVVCGS